MRALNEGLGRDAHHQLLQAGVRQLQPDIGLSTLGDQ